MLCVRETKVRLRWNQPNGWLNLNTIQKYNAGDYFEVLDKLIRTGSGGPVRVHRHERPQQESVKSMKATGVRKVEKRKT